MKYYLFVSWSFACTFINQPIRLCGKTFLYLYGIVPAAYIAKPGMAVQQQISGLSSHATVGKNAVSECKQVGFSKRANLLLYWFFVCHSCRIIRSAILPSIQKISIFLLDIFFTLFVFIYLRAKSYYSMGLYPIYIAFGAIYLETFLKSGWKKYLQPIAIPIPLLFFIPM
ncbi:hypothetical protein BH10BAC3_BH10BAC3_19790 [soil metagenome]